MNLNSTAPQRQRTTNITNSDRSLSVSQNTNPNATDTLGVSVRNDKQLQNITNDSVQVALLRLTRELEITNSVLASLAATVTRTGETNTRAALKTSRLVARVDKRVNFIKTEIYNEANVPPAILDATLSLLFVLKPNPIVETDGLYSILMGDDTSAIALVHYALSLWLVDELIEKGIDTDWLPPAVSESIASVDTDDHRIKMTIQMHASAKTQAEGIDWTAKLKGAAASINVYLSHSLMDLYNVSQSLISIESDPS
jgi:hypothetical protein